MMRVLIDSDVYLDYVLQRAPFRDEANQIFDLIGEDRVEAFVCALTPATVFYFTRKEKGIDGAYLAIDDLLLTSQICKVDASTISTAARLDFSDYEDAIQCASAVGENLDAIVTRNLKDYKKSPIPVYSPAEFLEVLQNDSAG